jgi:hypothetical protein
MRIAYPVRLSVGVLLMMPLWSCTITQPAASPVSTAQLASVTAEATATRPPDPSAGIQPTTVPQELSPGSLDDLDSKNGFRDLTFGDPPTNSMVLKDEAGEKKYYTRPEDDLSIGGARADQVIYGFAKNRLSTILIQTKGLTNSRALLEVLRHAYGPGSQSDPSLPRYTWRGSRVSVSYNENTRTHDADTWFHPVPVNEEESKGAEKANQRTMPQRPNRSWRWGPLDTPEGSR